MWGLAKVVRRPLAGRGNELLTVVARQQMSRSASVAVVRVADLALIVGITDNQVTLLGEANLDALESEQPAPVAKRRPIRLVADAQPVAADTQLVADGETPALPVARQSGPQQAGRLSGSLLSPQTWAQTVEFLRDRTVRK